MAQPNLQRLKASFQGITDEISLLSNLPAIDQGAQLLQQLQQMQRQSMESHQQIQAQFIRLETNMTAGFDAINARIDVTNARIDETNARLKETNARIDETNARLKETNARIDETNAQLKGTNARIDATNIQVEEIKNRQNETNTRIDVMGINYQARFYNSTITSSEQTLAALVDNRNSDVENFPRDLKTVAGLRNAAIMPLLNAYELSTDGTLDEKKRRFARFIGTFSIFWMLSES